MMNMTRQDELKLQKRKRMRINDAWMARQGGS